MTDHKHYSDPEEAPIETKPARRRMPFWKKALVLVSLCVMLFGLCVQGYARVRGKFTSADQTQTQTPAQPAPAPGRSFVAGEQSGSQPATTVPQEPTIFESLHAWSPAIIRFGLSFLIGFLIAYVLRTFLKISLAVIALLILVALGLEYAGYLKMDWSAMQSYYHTVADWLYAQTGSIRQFLAGHVPSAGMGGFGFLVGFWKN